MNNMASGSKDLCPRSIEEKDKFSKKQGSDFYQSSKNMRSMHSSEKSKNW